MRELLRDHDEVRFSVGKSRVCDYFVVSVPPSPLKLWAIMGILGGSLMRAKAAIGEIPR